MSNKTQREIEKVLRDPLHHLTVKSRRHQITKIRRRLKAISIRDYRVQYMNEQSISFLFINKFRQQTYTKRIYKLEKELLRMLELIESKYEVPPEPYKGEISYIPVIHHPVTKERILCERKFCSLNQAMQFRRKAIKALLKIDIPLVRNNK